MDYKHRKNNAMTEEVRANCLDIYLFPTAIWEAWASCKSFWTNRRWSSRYSSRTKAQRYINECCWLYQKGLRDRSRLWYVSTWMGRSHLELWLARRCAMHALYFGSFKQYSNDLSEFHKSLYRQKHAFYFRAVSKWIECLGVRCTLLLLMVEDWTEVCTLGRISRDIRWELQCIHCIYTQRVPLLCQMHTDGFSWWSNLEGCFDYIYDTLFVKLEITMKAVGEELETFRERCV